MIFRNEKKDQLSAWDGWGSPSFSHLWPRQVPRWLTWFFHLESVCVWDSFWICCSPGSRPLRMVMHVEVVSGLEDEAVSFEQSPFHHDAGWLVFWWSK